MTHDLWAMPLWAPSSAGYISQCALVIGADAQSQYELLMMRFRSAEVMDAVRYFRPTSVLLQYVPIRFRRHNFMIALQKGSRRHA